MRHRHWTRTATSLALLVTASFLPAILAQTLPAPSSAKVAEPPEGTTDSTRVQIFAIDPNTGQPTTAFPVEPNPKFAWSSIIAEAKAAEDGDNDLATASNRYVAIVRIFDELRPIAAEALYRYGIVEGKRQHTEELQAAHTRLIQWFPDFPDYAKKAHAAREAEPSTSVPGTGAAGGLSGSGMSPELRARYGLGPQGGKGSPTPGETQIISRMSPELRRRYGLETTADPAVQSSRSNDGNDFQREQLNHQRTMLLAESTRIASELRRATMELGRVAGIDEPRQIPPNLVNDLRLRALIEAASEPSDSSLPDEKRKLQVVSRERALEEYYRNVYLPRLQRMVDIQARELDMTRSEAQKVDADLQQLNLR